MKHPGTLRALFGVVIAALVVLMVLAYRGLARFDQEHQELRSEHFSLRIMESLLSSIKASESALLDLRREGSADALRTLIETRREFALYIDMLQTLGAGRDRSQRLDSLERLGMVAFANIDSLKMPLGAPTDTTELQRINKALLAFRTTRGLHGRMVRSAQGDLQRSSRAQERTGITTPLLLFSFGLLALTVVSLLFLRVLRAVDKAASAEQEINRKVQELAGEVRTREFTERSLKRVLDSSISGIMAFRSVRDETARIIDFEWILANHQAEVMLDRSERPLLGDRLLAVLPATGASGLFEKFIDVVSTGKSLHLEGVHDVNGMGLHLDIHAVKLDDGLVVTYTDVSDRERQRSILRESERSALTGKIARTIAHEVRNPLTNVLLALDQVKEEAGASSPIQPYADIVQRNVERIAQLITEMLESSKPREVHLRPTEIGTVLNDTVEHVRDRIELQRMGLSLDIAPDLPMVLIDRKEIELALTNIIINGIEAMEPSKGHLRIGAALRRTHVQVTIEDNGKGMADEDLARLFDPFYTGRPGGMGLGLTAARSILNSHGVHIDVNSQPGGGTVFTLTFPAGTA